MPLLDALTSRLNATLSRPVPLDGDEAPPPGLFRASGWTPAAVLIAITDRPAPGVLLTMRAQTMRRHAGQIAFPGGRTDPADADALATALREAHEEIALDPARVRPAGMLAPYHTITGFRVTPIVGIVPADLPLIADPREVDLLFEAPLSHLLAPEQRRRVSHFMNGKERHYYEILWEGHRIWGATAAMLINLADRVGPLDIA